MLRFALFVSVFLALPHLYVAARVIRPQQVSDRVKRGLYALLALCFALGPVLFALGRDATGPVVLALRYLTWTYLAFFSVLFALTLARDLGFVVARLASALRRRSQGDDTIPPDPARRAFLTASSGMLGAGASGLLVGVGTVQARLGPSVYEVEVRIPGLPAAFEGFHIVQISDVHVGMTIDGAFITPIVDQVLALRPDMIAATGDFVDGSVKALAEDVAPLGRLRAPEGVFFVTGNHEYYSGAQEWCAEFTRLGMRVLENEHVVLSRGADQLVVAGVTDYGSRGLPGAQASNPRRAAQGAPAHAPKILLAHQPRSAFAAAAAGFDLQLSGHTHGGQFFPWNLFVGLVHPVSKGLGVVDGMQVYVNRGTCYWGPPVRTMVPPEITSLRLRRA
ncbi:MAG: metallophosphoesterase [Myxococcales bacterium]|nr:metallophosphoesterase [Myxococcales bacterium]MCB9628119.1 metallophosphoesterase [Sandaracinaceae bacterium]